MPNLYKMEGELLQQQQQLVPVKILYRKEWHADHLLIPINQYRQPVPEICPVCHHYKTGGDGLG